ncbi:MAG: hypothetical protein V1701_01280 [Planctomycetota bacterium]
MAKTLYDRLNEIKTKHLSPQSVTGDKIADNAIGEKHIRDNSVTKAKIANGVIGKDEIADGAVTTPKIGELQITNLKIANNAVTAEKVADGAITAQKIADSAITTAKIATGAITRDKVADKSVGTADLVDGAVTNAKIGASAVTQAKLAANSVGASELQTNAVTASKISTGEVTPTKLAAIDSPADGEVPTFNQAQAKFEWKTMSGGGGITRPITPGITGNEITDLAVSETKIADSAVTSGKIADSCVKPSKLASANAPSNGAVLAYNESGSNFQWIGASGGDMLTLLQSQSMIFSEQSANNVDQIVDLPGFIPPVVKAVILEIQFNAMSVPLGLEQQLWVYGRRAGTDWGQSTIHHIWQNITNLNNNVYKECMIATDSDKKIRVIINKSGQFTSTNIWVTGYIE